MAVCGYCSRCGILCDADCVLCRSVELCHRLLEVRGCVVLVCVSVPGVNRFVACAVVMRLVGVVNRRTALGESERIKQ